MAHTFNVRIWAVRQRKDLRRTTAELRWKVGNTPHSESFATKTQADGRRAELLMAVNKGEAFDEVTGLPLSELRKLNDVSWYQHARDYIEMKWPAAPAKTRTTLAEAMASATPALVTTRRGMPDARELRRALYSWAFNMNRWKEDPPTDVERILTWVERNTVPVSALDDPLLLRKVLTAFTLRLDGEHAAASVIRRKRAIFHNALGFAVEARRLTTNPLPQVQWTIPDSVEQVDPGAVVNPRQARRLLDAVAEQGDRGKHLRAFFGCLYHAGMRPGEAVWLRRANCDLPATGWGTLRLDGSRPRVGSSWTDSGTAHDERGLKRRPRKEVRSVPIPPDLVTMLRDHLVMYGTAPDGRLFQTARGGLVQESGYGEVWARARKQVLTAEQQASALAARPYDLRHACVSLWLNSGVDPMEVARRAGHTVAVLLKVYAKCLDGATTMANARIDKALKTWK
ncbi:MULTISPECIES: tyrosine-type recombinase/integrase [Streptomyces violaceusniger group]|uniref:Integrase n=2 Tax=Streptomyces rapamycinicus TaxID=1226757 RepID=A0A0A0NIL1_STRRN|nr:tyrosine-type recombinase/integrase [Streptomyces rapamycinicus]AGP55898.1 integrase [Streptomyces rapamycinicus NRRL 5491]MBB4783485.1 integrase [Streptomyces rapamycinicus]RLV81040.1 integrase [Streptomyces rapamycinicus NRRL 5491]UTO63875.1 tyrosine-type recombinase/integrase [Streptomyces rapamycinicus]UTP31830.1 tyrosine-type recombinase/integrase [Streptomyces rapamycinicus NRRL 5491]